MAYKEELKKYMSKNESVEFDGYLFSRYID